MKVADVDTVMPKWVGLEIKLLSTFTNMSGHKFFEVELPLKDCRGKLVKVILSERQVKEKRWIPDQHLKNS